jgi:hypothetical protein
MSEMRQLARCAGMSAAFAFGLTACAPTYEFGYGGKPVLCVPKTEVPAFLRNLTHSSRSLVPGDAPTQLIIVHYDSRQVGKEIANFRVNPNYSYDEPPNVLSANIYLINDKYRSNSLGRAAGSDAENIWNRTQDCGQPTISRVSGAPTYFQGTCWMDDFWSILFNEYPGGARSADAIYNAVLAECVPTKVPAASRRNADLETCTRRFIFENYRIDYNF